MAGSEHTHAGAAVAARAEARWAWIVGAIILFLVAMMAYMSLHWAAMPPTRTETVDPTTLHIAGEFVETNLGSVAEPDGTVTVRVLANQYSFTPQCIVVPANTPLHFRGTAADVVHGFSVSNTNVNMMLVPGYISNFRTKLERPGEHVMPCHEYCGTGHAAMWAHVKVIDKDAFMQQAQAAAAAGRRMSCVQ
ncbi:cytochrome C oxidase subunit II [Massilia norwichensis]|uniref:Cytochrome C oxidase subunit II n=1 Tax=Massilia norwichensis TaxID=1442366 RepID=A0ABT2ABI5_9BURK|nr:cytochrome C oxidase subunit II [Massilia norwichensis]MCS0591573.1 cytochrome C oxidase subunit II [Massilia norwichensis]